MTSLTSKLNNRFGKIFVNKNIIREKKTGETMEKLGSESWIKKES